VRLSDLAAAVPELRVTTNADPDVRRAVYDSRRVERGDVFVAIRGATQDGATFARDAVDRGAAAVAADHEIELPAGVGMAVAREPRAALGDIASMLQGRPSEQLRLVGVTGTDGKTTTCQLIAQVLAAAGRRIAWMTTVDVRIGDEIIPNPFGHTTPEAPEIQETLARMVAAGVEDAVLEVSSHALALDRVRGCTFDAAVFTNLAPEHLNFHGTVEEYAAAKARLFEMLDSPTSKSWSRMGVVNADDPASMIMAGSSPAGIVSYALNTPADIMADRIELGIGGSRFNLVTPVGQVPVSTRLVGRHNVYNWLAAAAVALGWGIDLSAVAEAAATADPPAGRLERVRHGQPFEVIVDFAHTPQALEATLSTLRAFCDGRLYVVFGMPGGRDAANRPRMGELAARRADYFVVSTDDPLHEDPADIAEQILAGARASGAVDGVNFSVELDRRAAIASVLERAEPGDVVLLAAKGHEQRQLIGDEVRPWSDVGAAVELLGEMGYR
jgi:UDP-N-acetylmuramoyl-L-alanyl-D-glutamate--2,6-diaminopimelate ligase